MPAHEAENGSTFTRDLVDHTTLVFAFDAKLTLYTRTPLDVLIFIREGFT